jgi:hypothetical protein
VSAGDVRIVEGVKFCAVGSARAACGLDDCCDGHLTGKFTAVESELGELLHDATSERAARRWAQRYAKRNGGEVLQ